MYFKNHFKIFSCTSTNLLICLPRDAGKMLIIFNLFLIVCTESLLKIVHTTSSPVCIVICEPSLYYKNIIYAIYKYMYYSFINIILNYRLGTLGPRSNRMWHTSRSMNIFWGPLPTSWLLSHLLTADSSHL